MSKPSLYNPSYIEKIEEYLATTGREQTELPTREGFAKLLGVHRDTVNEWEHNNPEFKEALKKIDDYQKVQLMNDGLYGGKEVNSTMAIFLLKANHNMVETSHTDITTNGKDIAPMVVLDTKQDGK